MNLEHPNGTNHSTGAPAKSAGISMHRRKFLVSLLVIAFCVYFFNPFKPRLFRTKKKIILLGFDGADPRLVDRWWDELPNLQKLAQTGGQTTLRSSFPPESPVAWSCFAVGGNPGKHGVFDFLRRPAGSYFPSIEAFVEKGPARFVFRQIPVKMPKAILRRGGTAFWDILSRSGIPTALIEVPVTFPPPQLNYGRALSGLGVPDIRGIQATFHQFVYQSGGGMIETKESTFGGKIIPLRPEGEWYHGHIVGPQDPILEQERREAEKQRLDLLLEQYEWQAHLYNLRGDQHVGPEQKTQLADLINVNINASMAYQSFLHSEDFEERVQRIKDYLIGGKPYEKESGLTNPSTVRERMQKASIECKRLSETIAGLSREITAPVAFRPVGDSAFDIQLGDQIQRVNLLTWSDWFTIPFKVNFLIQVTAICRFYPQEISEQGLKIFMTSPDIDPRNPAIPITHPKSYAQDLVEWLGQPYKTRGWSEETHGLKDGYLGDDGFLEDLHFIMDQREQKLFETLNRTFNNVLISVFSETDRAAHMYMRLIDEGHPLYDAEQAAKYGGALKTIYKRMDAIVGKVMTRIENDPDTLLIVMSDHGFQSFRYQVNLNTWLFENGYLKIKGSNVANSAMKLEDLLKSHSPEYFSYVDWKGTKAYALGLGQIFINLKDREPLGIVEQDEYDALCDEIARKLETLRDEREGQDNRPVVAHVKKRSEIWIGEYADDAHDCPDLQVGFHPYYRVSWQTCLGGISSGGVIEDNPETWSGDHCSFAPEHVPGMLFANRPITKPDPSIYDFAPTILEYFGLQPPPEMEGSNLFA